MDVSQEVPIYFTLINQRMDQISYLNKTDYDYDYYYDYKFYINRSNLPNSLCTIIKLARKNMLQST